MAKTPKGTNPGPVGNTPVPQETGNRPRRYKPATPVIPGATVPETQNPTQVENVERGYIPDEEISTEPNRPRAGVPEEPEKPLTELPRHARTKTQRYK